MAEDHLLELVKNDAQLTRVGQFLPTLATREEMQGVIQAAVEPLATRQGLGSAIVPLATREELRAVVVPLATHEELRAAIVPLATHEEVKEEGTRLRRYIDVLIEDLRDDNRIVLEHLVALSARVDALAQR